MGLQRENVSENQDADGPTKSLETKWQWLESLQETHDTPISDKDRRRLEQELTADTCKIYINELKAKYEKKGGSKFMNAFEPVVEGLKAYTDGLNTLTKNSAGLSIAWGVIQLVLEVSFELSRLPYGRLSTWLNLPKCARHSHKVLGHIARLIGSHTHSLSLYVEYARDFIGYPRLDEALVSMHMTYLDTCIRSANFLKKAPSGMISSMHARAEAFFY